MKITAQIETGFFESSHATGIGEYTMERGRRKISWIQAAEEGESAEAQYTLVYDQEAGTLEVERVCVHISRMVFCPGVRTRGELRTPEGHFEIEILTHELAIPDNGLGQTVLKYELIFEGQEPIANTLIISISEVQEE